MTEQIDQFLITGGSGPTGHHYDIWEYDLERPRMPDSPDARMRYCVKRLVGSYRTLPKAEDALALLEEAHGH